MKRLIKMNLRFINFRTAKCFNHRYYYFSFILLFLAPSFLFGHQKKKKKNDGKKDVDEV